MPRQLRAPNWRFAAAITGDRSRRWRLHECIPKVDPCPKSLHSRRSSPVDQALQAGFDCTALAPVCRCALGRQAIGGPRFSPAEKGEGHAAASVINGLPFGDEDILIITTQAACSVGRIDSASVTVLFTFPASPAPNTPALPIQQKSVIAGSNVLQCSPAASTWFDKFLRHHWLAYRSCQILFQFRYRTAQIPTWRIRRILLAHLPTGKFRHLYKPSSTKF